MLAIFKHAALTYTTKRGARMAAAFTFYAMLSLAPALVLGIGIAGIFLDRASKKDRAAGRLLPGQEYRLPTDREWSAAMGVRDEVGEFPAERKFPTDVLPAPWGKALATPSRRVPAEMVVLPE